MNKLEAQSSKLMATMIVFLKNHIFDVAIVAASYSIVNFGAKFILK
jgi:hypothetical protein